MKKVFMTLTIAVAFSGIPFAQAPAKPAVDAAKAAPAKAKEAAKPVVEAAKPAPAKVKDAAKAAPAKMEAAAKPAVEAAQAAPAKVKKAKTMGKPATGTVAELDSTRATTVKMKKAKKMAAETTSTAMTFKCPKGDALSDGGGKCPKCGTEMVAMGAEATPKKAAKKATKKAMKMEAAPAKMEEKKG